MTKNKIDVMQNVFKELEKRGISVDISELKEKTHLMRGLENQTKIAMSEALENSGKPTTLGTKYNEQFVQIFSVTRALSVNDAQLFAKSFGFETKIEGELFINMSLHDNVLSFNPLGFRSLSKLDSAKTPEEVEKMKKIFKNSEAFLKESAGKKIELKNQFNDIFYKTALLVPSDVLYDY